MMKKLCSTFLGSTSFCFLKSFMRITYDLYQEMGKQLLDDWQTVDVSTGCDVALGLTQNSMFVLFFGINLEVSGAVKNGTILSFTVACGDPWWPPNIPRHPTRWGNLHTRLQPLFLNEKVKDMIRMESIPLDMNMVMHYWNARNRSTYINFTVEAQKIGKDGVKECFQVHKMTISLVKFTRDFNLSLSP